jgi:hypothetical protein
MRKIFLLITSLVISQLLFSQSGIQNDNYKLEESPKYNASVDVGEDNSIILKYNYSIEYVFEDGYLNGYILKHKKIRVLTDKGIEQNNKIYIGVGSDDVIVKQEARVISPSGEVTSLGDDAIKEGVDEESNYKYKYFAFEGIEKGYDLEYYYLVRRQSYSYRGRAVYLQDETTDKYDVDFTVIAPSNLEFKFKTFNALPEMARDTTNDEKNVYSVHVDTLNKFNAQKSAFEGANMQYVLFKLDKDASSGKSGFVSYGAVSQNIYDNYHVLAEKSDKKKISKLIKKMEVDRTSTESMIRSVENYLKTNFTVIESSSPLLSDVSVMLSNSAYNEKGATTLFCVIYDQLKVKHELVITCDRTDTPFDEKFEAYNFLDRSFLYFPEVGKYIEPVDNSYRLGYISPECMNTYGLFIKSVEVGDFVTGVGRIKRIKPLASDRTTSNLYTSVEFDTEFDSPTYEIRKESFGYYAYLQSYYDFVKEEDKREELTKSSIEYIDQEGDIEDLKVANEGGNNFGVKPLIISANVETDKFLEIAGTKYLFKVGELIGPQMELYQEEKRELPVQSDYNRAYHRELTFNIPQGYKIANLEDINMNITHQTDGDIDLAFISTFKQEGSTIKITIDEYYDLMDMPKEDYESYQDVVNAAADFNKIVLIYEPI